MKVGQSNTQLMAELLRQHQQVIHQQNLKEFERLNRQHQERFKTQECNRQWIKDGHVDVMV